MDKQITHLIPLDDLGTEAVTGGAELHLRDLLQAQVSDGWDVELIVLLLRNGPAVRNFLEGLRKQQVTVTILQVKKYFPKTTLLANGIRLAVLLRGRRKRIVHAHLDYAAKAMVVACFLCGHRKTVLTIHNDEPFYQKPLWRLRWALFAGTFRRMIAISGHVHRYMVEKVGLSAAKLVCIPHGIGPAPAQPSRRELRRQFGVAEKEPVVGFVGRLHQQKNPGLLIEALSRLTCMTGVFVGDGDLRESLERQARSTGARVLFLGSVPNARRLMPMFDMFCLPSCWEGFGIVLLEAMSAGIPVVGTASGAIPEVLGEAGLIVPGNDTQALADALAALNSNPSSARALGLAGQQRCKQQFGIDRQVALLNGVYGQVSHP